MNKRSHPFILRGAIASSSYSSRLRRGRRCWKSWQEMNERSPLLILPSAIAFSNYSSRLRHPSPLESVQNQITLVMLKSNWRYPTFAPPDRDNRCNSTDYIGRFQCSAVVRRRQEDFSQHDQPFFVFRHDNSHTISLPTRNLL